MAFTDVAPTAPADGDERQRLRFHLATPAGEILADRLPHQSRLRRPAPAGEMLQLPLVRLIEKYGRPLHMTYASIRNEPRHR